MNVKGFIEWLNSSKFAYPAEKVMKVCGEVQGFSAPRLMEVLSAAVSFMEGDELYMEVGVYLGRTLIGALIDNAPKRAVGIDNFSGFNSGGKNKEQFMANLEKYLIKERVDFYDDDFFSFMKGHEEYHGKVGVFFYDGDHGTMEALKGLVGSLPFLADEAVIVIDDASGSIIWETQARFISKYWKQVQPIFYMGTNNFPKWNQNWHNGVMVLHWVKGEEVPKPRRTRTKG